MVSARTTAPRTPRIFISTVLPISSRFSGTIAERRSGDGAYANVKFPCEGFPIESLRAFRQMLKCFLQKPEHASEEQERHQPARGTRQRCCGECRPFEAELGKNVSTVQHPVPAGMRDECGQDDRAAARRDGETGLQDKAKTEDGRCRRECGKNPGRQIAERPGASAGRGGRDRDRW